MLLVVNLVAEVPGVHTLLVGGMRVVVKDVLLVVNLGWVYKVVVNAGL